MLTGNNIKHWIITLTFNDTGCASVSPHKSLLGLEFENLKDLSC